MRACDVMTRKLVSIDPDASILEAARLMLQNRISGLPVIDRGGRLVGLVTEGDFLRRAETGTQRRRPRWLEFLIGPGRLATEYVQAAGRKVEEIMTCDVVTITQDATLPEIVELMEKRRIKRLPVMLGDKVLGIVTRANLLHAVASLATHAASAPAADDATIRERLLSEIDAHNWAPLPLLNVVVHDGTVELWGAITDERSRTAIRVAAENIPGVKAVRDHLAWLEPMSGMTIGPGEDPRTTAS